MSTVGMLTRSGRAARLVRNAGGEQIDTAAEASRGNPPHRLLWSTAIAALLLSIAAFVLWGINGAGILFDMILALCS